LTFDEQLQQALDTFANRLRDEVASGVRDEVARQVRAAGDELAARARSDREAADARAEQAAALARAEQAAAARSDQEAAAARSEQTAAERGQATGRLAEGIRTLGSAGSLSEVLDTLVHCAAEEAARAGVLLVRGERFHGWRFLGFDPSFETGDPLDIAREYAGVIAQAVESAAVASPGPNGRAGAPVFAQLPPGRGCVAVPIEISGQVVAVLYADAGQKNGSSNLEPGTLNAEPLEILTRFASQRLEALTAIKAARSLTPNPNAPSPAPGTTGESDDRHAAARRYARLLVSEITLYHEPQVALGRRERDLATRLGGEIARVRTLYEKRVPAEVRQSSDYVHEELIRTLADGDASLFEASTVARPKPDTTDEDTTFVDTEVRLEPAPAYDKAEVRRPQDTTFE
jgi:hypothetical protein